MTAEQLAQFFHETYERLAPQFGYVTRRDSANPWAEVPEVNRKLMIATCAEVLTHAAAQLAELRKESAIAEKYEQKLLRELGRVMTALRCTDEFDGPDEAVRTANELVQALGEADKIRAELGFADTTPLNVWLADLRAQLAEKEREIERQMEVARTFKEDNIKMYGDLELAEERLKEAQAEIKRLQNLFAITGERSTS